MDKNKNKYEDFHQMTSIQRKIIGENNFTYKSILQVINKYLKKTDKLIDIGCGGGTLCLYYGKKKHHVLGIDISDKAIDNARISAKFMQLSNVKFQQMNFPYEIPKEKFDFVIFTEVIEHLKDDDLALKQIFLLLKPNGIVFLSTPSQNAPMYKLGFAKEFDERVGHLRRYTVDILIKKCEKQGFVILETKKTEGILRNFLYLNPIAGNLIRFIKFFLIDVVLFIDKITMNLFGESNIFIVAKKP